MITSADILKRIFTNKPRFEVISKKADKNNTKNSD